MCRWTCWNSVGLLDGPNWFAHLLGVAGLSQGSSLSACFALIDVIMCHLAEHRAWTMSGSHKTDYHVLPVLLTSQHAFLQLLLIFLIMGHSLLEWRPKNSECLLFAVIWHLQSDGCVAGCLPAAFNPCQNVELDGNLVLQCLKIPQNMLGSWCWMLPCACTHSSCCSGLYASMCLCA